MHHHVYFSVYFVLFYCEGNTSLKTQKDILSLIGKINITEGDWAVILCSVVAFNPRRLVGMNAAAAGYIFDLQTNAEATGRSRLMALSLIYAGLGSAGFSQSRNAGTIVFPRAE